MAKHPAKTEPNGADLAARPEGVFDGIQSNRRTVNMPDGIKEKGDRHHRGERGLGVAAARRVGRDGAKLVIGARQITS